MMLEHGKSDVEKPRSSRYPWHVLREVGDYFVWSDRADALSIRSNSKRKGIKVSVTTLHDRTIRVQRVG